MAWYGAGVCCKTPIQNTKSNFWSATGISNIEACRIFTCVPQPNFSRLDWHASTAADDGQSVVNHTVHSIQQLAENVEETAEVIRKLESDSNQVGVVLDVIKGIAEQTNLLALNAAIEAARAGEYGKGFAGIGGISW